MKARIVVALEQFQPQPGGIYAPAELAANVSLVRPLALVGAKLTTCITETPAAVPQKRPRTSDRIAGEALERTTAP